MQPPGRIADADELALVEEAVGLARRLFERSRGAAARAERRQHDRLARLIADPVGRDLVFALTDQVLRIDDDRRAAERFAAVVDAHGTAPLGVIDRVLLTLGGRIAQRAPRAVMPLVRRRVAAETRGIVIPAEDRPLRRHLGRRRAEGFDLNVNPLGEAVLSDEDAARRVERVLAQVDRPDVDYVSIKISALVANLDVLAFDRSVERISARLREIYRAARAASPRTFVNLDMEAYADLELSLAAFMRVLGEDEFVDLDAGIALQAYLPDSHDTLDRLGDWAAARHDAGGGRIKVRIVKGANLAMERVEAEIHGWPVAPFPTKADVDASYKLMLDRALDPAWAGGLRIGVASHNLFDIAWAYVVARQADAFDRVEFEMLEGMAPAQARAVHELTGRVLMYAPVVEHDDVDASIAYLARRLDENTQPDNFLRALFGLRVDSLAWEEQERRFRTSVAARHSLSTVRRRGATIRPDGRIGGGFVNEPNTDFTLDRLRRAALDAAPPSPNMHTFSKRSEIDAVVARATAAFDRWSARSGPERRAAIRRAAEVMCRERFETVALMAAETGKTVREGDPEVSEAVDFARYYSGPGIDLLAELAEGEVSVSTGGRGVVAVLGPWNFPYAIPAGGVFAALAAGNAVVLKPAPEAARVGAWLVDQLHRGGLDHDLVQLVICDDGPVGEHLVTHSDVDTVVMTGAFETAQTFLGWKPNLRLFAETSGKNAIVVTATADLDQAVTDLVTSAFGHAGQKCSAASLAIVEAAVYDDPEFQSRLRAAAASRAVGWPDDPATVIGPVITAPTGKLERALTSLEPGERWLLAPAPLDESRRLWRPGIRLDVRQGTWFHRTECFGPVLGLMRADDLDHAIAIQNDSDFGLTGGIHSLDPEEIERWIDRVEVGNAYVNRQITGAVVRRQPFGGWKHSSIGPGAKAGGPNYVLQFSRLDEPEAVDGGRVERSYERAWHEHFGLEHDPSGLASESNVLRYRPVTRVVVRHDGTHPGALGRFEVAARVTGVQLVVSHRDVQSDEAFLGALRPGDRVRLVGAADSVRAALVARSVWVDATPPSAHGRVELVKWTKEQTVSRARHRHGRIAHPE